MKHLYLAEASVNQGVEAVATDCMVKVLTTRRRGFASDTEAGGEMKAILEQFGEINKRMGNVHKEMWDHVQDGNGDAFVVLCDDLRRSANNLAVAAIFLSTLATIAAEDPEIPELDGKEPEAEESEGEKPEVES